MTDGDVTIGNADVPIDWGNGDDDRGIINDTEDIGKDFGTDMEWAGESIGNTWESVSDTLGRNDDAMSDSIKADWDSGEYLGVAKDAVVGGFEDAGTVLAGVIGTVADGLGGLGAGAVAMGHDVFNVAEDLGSDVVSGAEAVGSGVESVAENIGSGVESVIDDIGDLF